MGTEPGSNCRLVGTAGNNIRSFRQSGIALIYVLLIFMLMTAIASEMVMNLWLHTEKNSKYLERTQAKHYALGAEQYVAWLLEKDFQQDKKNNRMVDHGNELWNVTTTHYDVDQGSIELLVRDEQGLFNINWLADDKNQGGDKPPEKNSSPALQMLANLLSTQSMDPQLALKVKRWVNKEPHNPLQSGEDQLYLSQEPARRTGQTEMASVSELLLIDGFNSEDIEKLLPYITVIPKSSKINMNTALPEVIRSLNHNLTEGDALAITNGRGNAGLSSMEELHQLVTLSGKKPFIHEGWQNGPVVFGSQYFSAIIKATYRDTRFYLKTLFYRSGEGSVQVVGREIGPSQYWVPAHETYTTASPGV